VVVRIACFQGPERPDTPEGNVDLLARVAQTARAGGAELLIAPELFLTGYAIGKQAVARLAEAMDGPSIAKAARIARDNAITLVLGFPERDGDDVYNTAIVIGADGSVLASYRKTHLFGDVDRQQFSDGGVEPGIFRIGDLWVGLLICYDVEFPENVRAHALRGADLVIVPTALMQPFDVVARIIVAARAYENQIFLAYVDRCGSEGPFDYCGLSCVVGPDGSDLARAGRGEELIFADLDRRALEQSRQLNTHLNDRRPELYGRLMQGVESNDREKA
jgi:predicted amidohydrolase